MSLERNIYYKKSSIEGFGLFAGKAFKKGDLVLIMKGVKRFKVNRNYKEANSWPDWVGMSKHTWIDPNVPYKYFNHSCNPNTGIKGKVKFFALRNIKKDEELTFDYWATEVDPRWNMSSTKCRCGSKKCRKKFAPIQYLPESEYNKYLPFVSTYFKKFYKKNKKSDKMLS